MPAFFLAYSAVELSSASEDDIDSEDSEQGEKGQTCSHCLTTGKYIISSNSDLHSIFLYVAVDNVLSTCFYLRFKKY